MDYHIEDKQGIRYLRSGESATQSAIDVKQPHKIILQNLEYSLGCLMFMQAPKKILLLGVGGGSLIHFFRHYCPKASLTGVDIDDALLEKMHDNFLLPHADDLLRYEIANAQTWVKHDKSKYDLIIVDLFNEQAMPEWIIEQEFMQDLNKLLRPNGGVTWNTLIETDHEFNHFYNNLRSTFQQHTLCLAAEDYENTIAYSFNFPLEQPDMGHLIQLAHKNTEHYELPFHEILNVIFNTNPIDSGFI